ncbi:MAG: DUF1759 domain-containing protein, partial [Gammaproteobacteria bacterium]|nr:DUF1759 domain-containing protein [Gammaproteobacteria bacterium]
MASYEDMVVPRGRLKAAITRCIQKLKVLFNKDDVEKVKEGDEKLQAAYVKLEEYIMEMSEAAKTEGEIRECETYLTDVQTKCSEALQSCSDYYEEKLGKKLMKTELVTDSKKDEVAVTPGETVQALKEIAALVSLPSLEIQSFEGDPLQYHRFISVFENSVDNVIANDSAKLNRLLRYTAGSAYATISGCAIMGGTAGYQKARQLLKEEFGNPLVIAERMTAVLRDGKSIRNVNELMSLSHDLINCDVALTKIGDMPELNSQHFLASVVNRLQPYLKNKWKRYATDTRERHGRYPHFGELCTFVRSEAKNASDPIYGENGLLTFGARPKHSGSQPRTLGGAPSGVLLQQGKSFATEVQGRKCKLCNDAHPLYACGKFKALKPSDRLKFLNSNQMCINCFLDNHVVKDCFKDSRCHIDGCTGKHSRFLHALLTQDGYSGSTDGVNQDSNSVSATTFATDSRPKVCLPTVQVNVNESFDALALLDTCSNSTFCSRVLFDKLDMNDTMLKSVDLELSTLNSSVKHERAHVVPSIEVKGQQGSSFILKNVYVVDKIPFQNCSFDVRKYAHLADIPVCSEFKTVDLLIGQDNSSVLIPLEVRKGDKFDQPFAVRTLLGWSIHGVVNNKYSGYCGMIYNQPRQSVICNFISNVSGTGQSVQKGSVEMKLDRLWKIDCELNSEEYVGVSKVDQEVLDLWNESVVVDDSQHYQLPIPWKPEVHVPNNYEVALSRLKSLNKSLEKRDLMQRYDSEIQKLLDNKFAEVVPLSDFESFETEDSKRVWYLPHHAVINDKKPDKLRVVFDCAAEFRGSSLNDKCKQGPDLINKLVHVLLRFRQFQFAIMSDIEAMYYQVRVDPKDRDALRFLWFDKQGNIVQYRMTVHVFGGIWCACISTYALRRILDDQNVTDMFIQNVVNRSFYVDDCLLSASDICSLQKLVVDVRQVLKQGGFNLTKFVTNSAEVMSQIAVQDRAKEAKEFNDDIQSKALGIKWEVIPDSFVITVGKLDRSKSGSFISKRDMLSTLASMYDPLGLVIPYTMKGKMIFQEATRVKLDWGDKLPEWLSQQWKVWLEEAEELKDLQFFRCLIPNEFIDSVVEVHNFSDASEKGYGCCSYMRCIKGNKVHVSLIASKGRLCPIKQMSIPRLELQAAVMAAKLNHTIVKQLDVQISKSYFWTDSQIVLSYIQNEDKRFKTFVANRVEQIKSLTSKDQWAYVASKQNPADLISRGTNPSTLSQSIWTKGPEFLSVPDLPNPSVQIV